MTRRLFAAFLALAFTLAPFPAWAQVGHVTIDAPLAPTPALSAGAINAVSYAPSLTPATLTLGPGLTSALSAPAAQPLPFPQQPVAAAQPVPLTVSPITQVVPASQVVRRPANDDYFQIVKVIASAAQEAAQSPEKIGRLYESAPSAPDLESLATVKTPAPPAPWQPGSAFLKPAASVVNAWRLSRYEKRLYARLPHERVTTEELGMQDTLVQAHESIATGRLQEALDGLTSLFLGRDANRWFRANPNLLAYQFQGHDYIRFVERAVKLAYERAHGRAREMALVAEARAAARDGSLLGHEWRVTAIQAKDSAHCVHYALFNAIQASVGFVYPLSVANFVEHARRVLNVNAEKLTGTSGADLAALENTLGIKFGSDVGQGMGPESIARWAQMLGMGVSARGPPHGDAEWTSLLGRGQEVLISLRLFHERFKHSPQERELHGHDYQVLHHEVYLLGSFVSPSRGVRLYMIQDSGSGSTDFYTAEELTAVASDIQVLTPARAVALP